MFQVPESEWCSQDFKEQTLNYLATIKGSECKYVNMFLKRKNQNVVVSVRAKNGSLMTYTTESASSDLLEMAQNLEHKLVVRQVDSSFY